MLAAVCLSNLAVVRFPVGNFDYNGALDYFEVQAFRLKLGFVVIAAYALDRDIIGAHVNRLAVGQINVIRAVGVDCKQTYLQLPLLAVAACGGIERVRQFRGSVINKLAGAVVRKHQNGARNGIDNNFNARKILLPFVIAQNLS